jgi:CheY-like chemotaxis protein
MPTLTFDAFRDDLHEALNHIHDPAYDPPASLYQVLDCPPRDGAGPVQSALVRAIMALQPELDAPAESQTRRTFELLKARFLDRLTQDDTAERLEVSPRHVRRIQQEAIHALARTVWEQPASSSPSTTSDAHLWRSQVQQDLASLRESAAQARASVADTIDAAVHLEQPLAQARGVSVTVDRAPPTATVAAHPTLLRQAVVTALSYLLQEAGAATVTVRTQQSDATLDIVAQATSAHLAPSDKRALLHEILAAVGGSARATAQDDGVTITLRLPTDRLRTVLVVDDNEDIVHFYRRAVRGTRYRIAHTGRARGLRDVITRTDPDLLVLDVMLPDADGWELLTFLHEDPATRALPIVVCTVMRERELALALGAAAFLAKPIQHAEFVATLQRVLADEASPTDRKSVV